MQLVIQRAVESDGQVAVRLLMAQLVEHHLPADAQGVARGIELAMERETAWLLLGYFGEEPGGVFLANEIVSVEQAGIALWVGEVYVVPGGRGRVVSRGILD